MKIYTRTGDEGTTGLIGGSRAMKNDPRIDCYGTVDELNAAIGLAACDAQAPLLDSLRRVQNELFVVGSHLATPADASDATKSHLPSLDAISIDTLEREIDTADAILPPLRQFILPGGSELGARLHLARTICRRAERGVVGLPASDSIHFITRYLNRLSDWLFVVARRANLDAAINDIPWQKL